MVRLLLHSLLENVGGWGVRLKLNVRGQEGGNILDVDRGWAILKITLFSWMSYVYCPFCNDAIIH